MRVTHPPTHIARMDGQEDFNQLLKSNLSKKLSKTALRNALETCKNVLKSEINQAKNVESIFQEETWDIFNSAMAGIEDKRLTLELLQLFTVITPKGILNNLNIIFIIL